MMKRYFTSFAAVAALALSANAQQITISSIDQQLANDYAGGCEIDLNNDGLKELIVSGFPQWGPAGTTIIEDAEGNEVEVDRNSWILKWNGSAYDKVKQTQPNQIYGIRATIIPADFNGDGNIDIFAAGEGYDYTGIYLNDGQGNLTRDASFKVLDFDGNETEWYPRSADVADFNLDGRPDIVTIGWSAVGGNRQANVGVLINQGDGSFKNALETGVVGNAEVDFEFALCTVRAFDLNNDGYADFLLQGNIDNEGVRVQTKNGNEVNRTFMAFMNMADPEITAFYDLELAQGVAHQFGNGNIDVCDFNNDGTPDIFVTGESPDDAVAGWDYFGQLLIGKIANGEVSYTDNSQFIARGKDIRPLNSNNVGVRHIDYNGDGFYDLFLLGWSPGMLDGEGATQAGWFLPGSANGLTSYQRIPGASEQGIFFLDYGVEGAINYTFTGYHGDGKYFQGVPEGEPEPEIRDGRSMVFTKNPFNPAARPAAPASVSAEVDGSNVALSWTAGDAMKNVTYEYFIKGSNGRFYNNVTSFVGGNKDGVRKVLREGNAFMNTALNLTNLPDGNYTWGVQTINAALLGSTFTTGSFQIGEGSGQSTAIVSVENDATVEAVYNAEGKLLSAPTTGINIVKSNNGNVRKVVK